MMVESTFFKNATQLNTLVVVFPGAGYHCDMPLLYYCTDAAFQLGADIVKLKYALQRDSSTLAQDMAQAVCECHAAVANIIATNTYKNIVFASKSRGTVFAGEVAQRLGDKNINHFFMTPLVQTIPFIKNCACTVVVGSDDNLFSPVDIQHIRSLPLPKVHVVNQANHALEIAGNSMQSIAALAQVTGFWLDFLGHIVAK